jgi:hypothetical protein
LLKLPLNRGFIPFSIYKETLYQILKQYKLVCKFYIKKTVGLKPLSVRVCLIPPAKAGGY